MRKFIQFPVTVLLLLSMSCGTKPDQKVMITADPISHKVDSVLSLMTLQEKIGQLNQYNGFWDITGPVPKDDDSQLKYANIKKGYCGSMLNVTSVEKVREAQRLCMENSRLKIPMIFGYDVIHGYQTMMPIPLAEAASWDLDLMSRSAGVAAREAAAAGINWTFAPMVDISRDARWGRVMEGAGEDPYYGALVAKARVLGFQGDLSSAQTVAACAKHFAGYGFAESGRDYNSADFSLSTLYNIVLPPFKAAAESDVATFMNAFNDINGTPATGNVFLQREILKGKWQYKGFVVSDWASIMELREQAVAKDDKEAAELALNAGSDMDMEGRCYINHLEALVKEGKVSETKIDEAVRRILRIKFMLGLFADPYKYCNSSVEKTEMGKPENLGVALEAAQKSIVLLKNEKELLPLKTTSKVALLGSLAADKDSPLGSWRAKAITGSAVSVLEGMTALALKGSLSYEKGCVLTTGQVDFKYEVAINQTDKTGFKEAINLAKNAEVVVMVLGENCFQSGEGRSRTSLSLPGLQLNLLKEVYAVNKNIVLVLMNGRPLALEWEAAHIPAIVEAWHLGSMSGKAIADVLYGVVNPAGKLPMSFPYNVGQLPLYYNQKNTGRPMPNEFDAGMVFYSHYSDVSKKALFPFGFGLSYTTFAYGEPKLAKKIYTKGETIQVNVRVQNTGKIAGEEVVQLYIRDKVSKEVRPIKELKGFEKVNLAAGESKTIQFDLKDEHLGYYLSSGDFVVETGDYDIMIGTNSEETQKVSFELK